MRSRGPLITLLAGLALAGVLVTLSMNATRSNATPTAGGANAPAATDDGAASDVSPEEPAADPSEAPPDEEAVEEDVAEDEEAAPAAPANNKKTTWAGEVEGDDTTVAIVAEGDEAIAYVCDGEEIEAWLKGSAADGKLDLATPAKSDNKGELTGTFGNGRAKGTINIDGQEFTFNVAAVKKPSGLYRATADVRGARLDGGWIVLADGSQVGLATFAGSVVAVPRLNTSTLTTTMYGERISAKAVAPGGGS